jgi:hypothetical protein
LLYTRHSLVYILSGSTTKASIGQWGRIELYCQKETTGKQKKSEKSLSIQFSVKSSPAFADFPLLFASSFHIRLGLLDCRILLFLCASLNAHFLPNFLAQSIEADGRKFHYYTIRNAGRIFLGIF